MPIADVSQPATPPAVGVVYNNEISFPQKTSAVNFRPRLLFRRTLSFGSSGKDAQLLCKLLNKDPDTRTDPQRVVFGRPYT